MSPWLAAGVVLSIAFIALGFFSQRVHDGAFAMESVKQIYVRVYSKYIFNDVMGGIPALGALVMLWTSFANPRWSDRLLWSATMIFTATVLGVAANGLLFGRTVSPQSSDILHTYPNPYAVAGMVGFVSWILVAYRSNLPGWARGVLLTLSALSLLLIPAYMIANPYIRPIDMLGSACFSGALLAFGVFVANRVGANILAAQDQPSVEATD